jgi:hypothetical protein
LPIPICHPEIGLSNETLNQELAAIPATLLCALWLLLRGIREIVGLSRGAWRGQLVDGVYQDPEGRRMVYWHGSVVQDVFRRSDKPETPGRIRPGWRKAACCLKLEGAEDEAGESAS